LAAAPDTEDAEIRRRARELEARWKKQASDLRAPSHGIETRFRSARTAVENSLASRARAREAAVWTTLAAKERLCDELDRMALAGGTAIESRATDDARGRWEALPPLPRPWETRLLARRDAALAALAADGPTRDYASRIEQGNAKRREILLELEIALGIDSPAELKAQRLALQIGQLKRRFHGAERDAGPRDTLLAWCAEPGVADERDRLRCEKVFAAVARM
jgi:hypothetical protein